MNSKEKQIFFFFRSNDWNVTSTGAFDVILPYQINRCTSITLVNYGFPNSYYNIDAKWNSFRVLVGSTPYVVSISAGIYANIAAILSALKTQLDAATSLTWTLSQNSSTLKVTLSTSSLFYIDISYNNGNNLNEVLNLESINTTSIITSYYTGSAYAVVGVYVSNEFPYKTFRIHCDLCRNILNKTRDAPVMAEIPISTGTSTASTQVFAYNAGSISFTPARPSFQTFSFLFTDQYDRSVDFHGEDVFLCLKFNFND